MNREFNIQSLIRDAITTVAPTIAMISTDHPCEPRRYTFDTATRTPPRDGGRSDRPVTLPTSPHGWSVLANSNTRTSRADGMHTAHRGQVRVFSTESNQKQG